MLEMFSSQFGTGNWGKANVYNPPTLQWYFDNNLTLSSPPGTAVMVSYVQQRWFMQ